MLICMDCNHEIVRAGASEHGGGLSHGLCVDCFAQRMGELAEEDLTHLAAASLELLPCGAILLDRELRVVAYNVAESKEAGFAPEQVIGRPFFTDIAPCMAGAEVGDWCASHVGGDHMEPLRIDWLLRLRDAATMATLDLQAGLGRVALCITRMPTEQRRPRPT